VKNHQVYQYFSAVKLYIACHAAKLIMSHGVVCNRNQGAFLVEEKTAKCECSKQMLVTFLVPQMAVFCCIYDEYHSESCRPVTLI
jgi:hypothetical protein